MVTLYKLEMTIDDAEPIVFNKLATAQDFMNKVMLAFCLTKKGLIDEWSSREGEFEYRVKSTGDGYIIIQEAVNDIIIFTIFTKED